ncbi:conserved protein of unknown function [Sterolibacterium denitrificans]|uniref:Molecular chaperone n=1 Tax=Sterolibacterium denitrificans TaxID=157592 RepID=A0A7Z7HN83_9PROT|nr:hypothetical protein [Sterolibacterium denitrificans]SMB21044.1 conserved protein of unknown function [Sterolibacterium denitrificans]
MSSTPFGLDLPQLSADAPPLFTDAASCRDWIGGIVTEQVHQTQALLLRQLNLLNRYALPATERYAILDLLRESVHAANEDGALRFTARPLPLTPPEQAAFDTCQTLWQALEIGYLHCLQKFTGNASGSGSSHANSRQIAQAAARVLGCLSASYIDACRAAILPPPGFWARLHRIHHLLEQRQLTQLGIDDPQRESHPTGATLTAASLYVELLLLAAAHPLELDPAQLSQVVYWSRLWAHKVTPLVAPPADLRTPPLGIDISGDAAGAFKSHPAVGSNLRWLNMANLRLTIKQTSAILEQGDTLESLWLDQDAPTSFGLVLLRQVYQDWCRGGRGGSGRKTTGHCRLIPGVEAIHQRLAATGAETNHPAEDWQKISEHVARIHLQRPLNQAGRRLTRTQLVAVCMNDGDSLLIGKLQWIAIGSTRDALLAGIHILPGRPTAVTLQSDDVAVGGAQAEEHRGFLLPAIPSLDEPASILLPPRWFRPGQAIRIEAMDTLDVPAGSRKIYLRDRLDNGVDFVRCTFIDA